MLHSRPAWMLQHLDGTRFLTLRPPPELVPGGVSLGRRVRILCIAASQRSPGHSRGESIVGQNVAVPLGVLQNEDHQEDSEQKNRDGGRIIAPNGWTPYGIVPTGGSCGEG